MTTIRRIIRECGLTTAELARASGLSRDALNSWLAGRREPQAESVRKMADGLADRSAELQRMADQLRRAAE
jgi:transcriptional regulator with XRE-family HTH domain